MDRSSALARARELAQQFNWGPSDYSQAVSFEEELEAKHFIELEGGGKEKLTEILEEKYYTPYTWLVRHFKEYQTLETYIEFTPEGKPYGFEQKIPETMAGAALTAEQARTIAESVATGSWHVDLSAYKLIESSQEKKPNGRIDHTFSYERAEKTVGEGRYRLKLIVSGDQLTELSLFLKVPEAFTRRYEYMRSANNTLAFAADIAIVILYLLIGCLVGLAYLHRRRWIIWRPAAIAAFILAFMQILNALNYLPLRWMGYDTAVAQTGFLANLGVSLLASLVGYTIALSIIFMTAEGLTRAAFGDHPQLWRVWTNNAASSVQILGRTLASYLVISFDMAYIIGIYLFASRYLGWWSPAETLFNPNVLASYVPWLSAISQSLNAGFMEESLFRAIPLAGAVLIGQRFGKPKLFLAAAFVIQAIIFGAAHANYPAQPAYARLVELIIPSFLFAWFYLKFGLLTSIIFHVVYDIFWFALPIFIAAAPGIWIDKIAVVVVSLIPVWIVLKARAKVGRWTELADIFYNRAWLPSEFEPQPIKEILLQIKPRDTKRIIIAGILAIIGATVWVFTTRFTQDNLSFDQTKSLARQQATQLLQEKQIQLAPPFKQLVSVEANLNDQHRFVWKTAGKQAYHTLLGSYLLPALWKIRYAQFEGDIVQRAQEYQILIDGHNTVQAFEHQLPETAAGKTLSEQEARIIAHDFIKNWYQRNATEFTEISAVSTKLPERLDWSFTFSDNAVRELNSGQARMDIKISGSEVADYSRYIFVPEQWQRQDRQEQLAIGIIQTICMILAIILSLLASLFVLKQLHLFRFNPKLFSIFFVGLLIVQILNNANMFETVLARLSTAQPLLYQIGMVIAAQFIIMNLLYTSLAAYLATMATGARSYTHIHHSILDRVILAAGSALILEGGVTGLKFILPQLQPLWAEYGYSAATIPIASIILSSITRYVFATALLGIFVIALDYVQHSTGRWIVSFALAMLFILLISGMQPITSLWHWLIIGLIFGILFYIAYWLVLKEDRATIPFVAWFLLALYHAQQIAFNAWPGAAVGYYVSMCILAIIAYWWSQLFERMHRKT